MAAKTTANWSQGNGEKIESRVVYTRKNTPFAEWTVMLKEELAKVDLKFEDLHRHAALHAWESDDTPSNFAFTMITRLRKAKARDSLISANPFGSK